MEVLKKKFDTQASLKDQNTELVLQGTFLDQVKDYLVMELKFKEDNIEMIDKVSKKKKEKGFMT